jgi:hypothetical protein
MISYRASIKACTALIAAGAALGATAAQAAIDQYSVPASSRVTVNLEVCSAESQLAVLGDTGTDLDFVLTDAEGTSLHVDEGVDDYLSFVIEQEGEGCATYSLAITNLGEEANDFTVALEPIMADTTRVRKYIIGASETQTIPFKACGTSAMVSARGDGDTDLDFEVIDQDGDTIYEDYDLSDVTEFTLNPGNGCADYQLNVSNLGEVYNLLTVAFLSEGESFTASANGSKSSSSAVVPAIGFAKGLGEDGNPDRSIIILNQSGEQFSSIYWSNSATFGWGDDMLGEGSRLAAGADWEVDVADGSNACLFDFRAVTESQREIMVRAVNVCDIRSVTME